MLPTVTRWPSAFDSCSASVARTVSSVKTALTHRNRPIEKMRIRTKAPSRTFLSNQDIVWQSSPAPGRLGPDTAGGGGHVGGLRARVKRDDEFVERCRAEVEHGDAALFGVS